MKLARATSPARPYTQTARAASAEDTARRIIGAFTARLMTHWFDEITLDAVAADADVTVQTIIRRFGGKDGLLPGAVEIIAAQVAARRDAPPGDIDASIRGLVTDYEHCGDAILRLLALESRHEVLHKFLEIGRGEHRAWVAFAFQSALVPRSTRRANQKLDRRGLLDALVIATDVYAWKLLRRDMKRSVSVSAATMSAMCRAIVDRVAS